MRRAARWPRLLYHQVRVRPRLASAVSMGLAVLVLLSLLPRNPWFHGPARALAAWDVGTGLYLVLAWKMMLRDSVERMRWRARLQDDGAVAVLGLSVAAAIFSLAAIVVELVKVKGSASPERPFHLGLAAATIGFSWCFVHTAFALHYAHEFYIDRNASGGPPLEFPGGDAPNYVDFLYFSFVIGITSQTADVAIGCRRMRGLALLHGVIAFFFNTTLLALSINIAASLV